MNPSSLLVDSIIGGRSDPAPATPKSQQQESKTSTSCEACKGKLVVPLDYIDMFSLVTEEPVNHAIETILLIIERKNRDQMRYPREEFEELLDARLLAKHYRFRCRVSADKKRFEEIEGIRARDHIRYIQLDKSQLRADEEDDERLLRECLSSWQNKPLPLDRPLWEVVIVENYSKGYAMFWRIHHCIGDGFSLEAAFCSLCDQKPTELFPELVKYHQTKCANKKKGDEDESKSPIGDFLASLVPKLWFAVWLVFGAIIVFWRWFVGTFYHEAKTCFRTGKLGVDKRLAWIRFDHAIPVSEVKAVGKPFGATVNDVMLTCLAGGMNRYMNRKMCLERQQSSGSGRDRVWNKTKMSGSFIAANKNRERIDIRVGIPINLRTPSPEMLLDPQLGNKFGFVLTTLPIAGIQDPVKRMKSIMETMSKRKHTPEPLVSYNCIKLTRVLPTSLLKFAAKFLSDGVTIIATNIRGAPIPLTLHGYKVIQIIGFAPPPNTCELAASIMSYNGKLALSLNTNANSIEDPEVLVEDFVQEYQYLKRVVASKTE
eukprot:GEZU01025812.1.p1 GENE.GEZU01025812.1~~GEZU01025812.1.p1  ORF type:complete len:543 (+),score=124.56 GEZU01025812.1:2-1630(+)